MKNMLIKVLSVVMALTMIMGACVTVASAVDVTTHVHNYDEVVSTVDATCLTPGFTVYECECGDTKTVATSKKLEVCSEEFLTTYENTAPTCTEPGYLSYTECTLCGKVSEKEVDPNNNEALGHDWKAVWGEEFDPSCGKPGKIYKVCQREGCDAEVVAEEIPNLDHYCTIAGHNAAYVYYLVKAPTCTENGVAEYKCPIEGCESKYVIPVMKRGHDLSTTTVDATCTEKGLKTTTCSRCDYKTEEEIPALGHIYDSDPVAPGIQNDLVANDKCVVDNDVVDVLYKAPTCYQDGYAWYHCLRCECPDFEDAYVEGEDDNHLIKVTLSKNLAHDWIMNGEDYRYFFIVNNVASKVYNSAELLNGTDDVDNLAEFITWLEANFAATGFVECTDSISGYKKCADCGVLEHVVSQSQIAPGHFFESKEGNGADEIVKNLPNGNPFIDTKGWDIVYDTTVPPCKEDANGKKIAENYAIRECKECNYQDPEGSYYFTVNHVMVYVCEDITCTTKKTITTYRGTEIVDYCYDCTHTGRVQKCYVCDGESTDAKFDAHDWVVKTENGAEVVAVAATCILPAKYTWVCANGHDCAQTRNEYKVEQIKLYDDANDNGKFDWGEEAYYAFAEFVNPDNHKPYDANTGEGVKEILATCIADGSKKGFCTWCGTDVNETYPKGNKDDINDPKHGWVIKTGDEKIEASCMATGKEAVYTCEHCASTKGGDVIPKDFTAAGHARANCTLSTAPVYTRPATCTQTYADVYQWVLCKTLEDINPGQKNPANHVKYVWTADFAINKVLSTIVSVEAVAPTCTTAGTHAFTYCSECDYVVTVDTETCVYDNHRTTNDGACGTVSDGACAYDDCTLAHHTVLESYAELLVKTVNGANVMKPINDYYNTVTELYGDGKNITAEAVAAYYELNNKYSDVKDDFVIAALGHNFWFDETATTVGGNILRVMLMETCTTPGHEWKIACSRDCCKDDQGNYTTIHEEMNGETIAPHGIHAENITRNDEAKEPTCTESGKRDGLFCELCPNVDTDIHGQACAICNGPRARMHINALGHDNMTNGPHYTADATCGLYGIKFYKCFRCFDVADGYWFGDNYVPATGNHDLDTEKTQDPTCTVDGYKYQECKDCDYVKITEDETLKAVGHMHDGDKISFSCLNDEYLIYKGTKCDECGVIVRVSDGNDKEVIDGIHNVDIEHNYVEVVEEAGCEAGEDGARYLKCTDCGTIKKNSTTVIEAPGHHDYGTTKYYECATAEKDGKWEWYCAKCGELQVEVVTLKRNLALNLSVAPYINGVEADKLTIVNGGYIKVTLSVTLDNAAELLEFNSLNYKLAYNENALAYVDGTTVFGEDAFVQAKDGTLAMIVTAVGDEVYTFEGVDTTVAEFIFKVAPGVDAISGGFNDTIVGNEFALVNHDSAQFNADAAEDIASCTLNQINTNIDAKLIGDMNADGAYTADDTKLIRDAAKGLVEYTNVADINSDGVVDSTDFVYFARFMAAETQSVAEYYAMLGIDLAEMVAGYDFNDYDDSKVINSVDAKLFANAAASYLSANWNAAVANNAYGDFTAILDAVDTALTTPVAP